MSTHSDKLQEHTSIINYLLEKRKQADKKVEELTKKFEQQAEDFAALSQRLAQVEEENVKLRQAPAAGTLPSNANDGNREPAGKSSEKEIDKTRQVPAESVRDQLDKLIQQRKLVHGDQLADIIRNQLDKLIQQYKLVHGDQLADTVQNYINQALPDRLDEPLEKNRLEVEELRYSFEGQHEELNDNKKLTDQVDDDVLGLKRQLLRFYDLISPIDDVI